MSVLHHFKEYSKMSGFPEVLKTGDATLLQQYYSDILYRDVIARYGIKNTREIKELTLYLATNPATIQSYQNIRDLIGVRSVNTVKNYLSALNDVYLFFFADLFDYSIKRQIYNPSKAYCIDTALADAFSFRFSKNTGKLYENIVFLELKRRNKEIYYGRSHKGGEVDFIIKEGLQITEAIQICVSITNEKTLQRELKGLDEVCGELEKGGADVQAGDIQMTILTEDDEKLIDTKRGAVRVVPLWKWLIEDWRI